MKMTAMTVALAAAATSVTATPVLVEIHGEVWGNMINSGILGAVTPGQTATIAFQVDSEVYLDGAFPTRGYEIDLSTFSLSFSGGASIGLAPVHPGTAYFVLRDNDPAVDGFFLSYGTDWDTPLDLDQVGAFGNFGVRFNVTYLGDLLDSLDILDAAGTYAYDGLTVFGMGVTDGPVDSAMGIDFLSMSITVVPAPSAAALLGLAGVAGLRRRR